MGKVYILKEVFQNDEYIVGVFSTEELADNHIENNTFDECAYMSIEKYKIDELVEL